ncbi:MAG: acyl-CoA dehydrogenase family protein, partial [Pseudonocardia sp.]|nr:acyl-CoA dehydrogenase family protein [Pseudonocardia sp.]
MTGIAELRDLEDLAESVFAAADAEDAGFDAPLWATLTETGLARLTLPEEVGGSGAGFAESAVVLAAAGEHAARVPLVETDLLAGWLLRSAGIELPDGPLTLASGDLDSRAAGVLRRVPWARAAAGVVVLAGDAVLLFDPAGLQIADGMNVAEEPRDTVTVDGAITA